MTRYAVFFTDEQGAGIQMVQAMDPGHAKDIVSAEHPSGRMSVIEAEQLEGVNRKRVLWAWLETVAATAKPGGSPARSNCSGRSAHGLLWARGN